MVTKVLVMCPQTLRKTEFVYRSKQFGTRWVMCQILYGPYHQLKEAAWGRELPLTPKEMEHMEMVFDGVNVWEFCLTTHMDMTWYCGTISKNTETAREYHVRLPKESYNGSYFGK